MFARIIHLLLFLSPLCLCAQTGNVTSQQQVWYGYYNTATFGSKWTLQSELENRQFFAPKAQNTLIIREHLHYKFAKAWDVALGFAYVTVTTQNPHVHTRLVTPEVRPFEEANHYYSKGRIALSNRLRFEQRWVRRVVQNEFAEGFNFSVRLRYRLAVDVLLFENKAKQHAIKLKINDEIMLNRGKQIHSFFDQNRIYAGINYHPPGPMSFEVGYLNWFQERPAGNEYFLRHVIRFSIFHRVSFPMGK